MDGWMDARKKGWINGQMDAWMHACDIYSSLSCGCVYAVVADEQPYR